MKSMFHNDSSKFPTDSDFDAARCQQFGGSIDRRLSPGPHGNVTEIRGSRYCPTIRQTKSHSNCPSQSTSSNEGGDGVILGSIFSQYLNECCNFCQCMFQCVFFVCILTFVIYVTLL